MADTVDWNALAAQVMANYEATGQWFVGELPASGGAAAAPAPASTTVGSGPDSLVLKVSEDAFQGDAQYTISVDGVQIGGTLTAHASHAAGQDDIITVNGDWGPGNHAVTINFLNDLFLGTTDTDRNLYVDGATYNGAAVENSIVPVMTGGLASFNFMEVAPPVVTTPPAAPAPSPTATATPGYHVVLADDFSGGYNKANWGDPFPLPWANGPSANGAFIWDAGAVGVHDGEMQINTTLQSDGWHTTGFNSFKAGIGITYGKVDFDAKMDPGQGTAFGILMWPSNDSFPPEIDMVENPKNQGLFTLHWDDGSSPILKSNVDTTQWHHYTLNWLPDHIEIQVDGQTQAWWSDHIPNEPMSFGALGVVGSPWDGWMGGAPDSTTPHTVTLHLDNVVVQQWDGIA